ncbi:MAG: hypothetical protein JXA90_05815 [Planctomycetes bacterium]|nr:hypothetical protein [Planctomycetota bacterium]
MSRLADTSMLDILVELDQMESRRRSPRCSRLPAGYTPAPVDALSFLLPLPPHRRPRAWVRKRILDAPPITSPSR